MTRKDYIETAQGLKAHAHYFDTLGHYDSLVDYFADWFEEDNPRFNRETFRKACGLE